MAGTLSLIGMPGAGKSTVGVLVARHIGLNLLDTDLLIQARHGRTLQQLLDSGGYLRLRHLEERMLLEAELDNCVVATGGSAVYSEAGMRRLRRAGPIVFIHVALAEIARRVHDEHERGIARAPGVSLEAVYRERLPLYRRWADHTIPPRAQSSIEATARAIADWWRRR